MCNLLLKQGQVDPILHVRCINLLGSNDEKEEFFKDFELPDQLLELYKSRHKFSEAYFLSVQIGDLAGALKIAVENDLPVVEDELELLIYYVMAQKLLSSDPSEMKDFDVSQISLANSKKQWDAAFKSYRMASAEGVLQSHSSALSRSIQEVLALDVSSTLHQGSVMLIKFRCLSV